MQREIHVWIHHTRDEFKESEHPRKGNGEFGNGSGGKSSKSTKPAKLSSTEEYALDHYVQPSDSDTGFLKLNSALRTGKDLSADQKKQVSRIDSALEKVPKFEGRTFRGVHFGSKSEMQDFLKSHEEGSIVSPGQYTSTSKNSSVATGDVRIVIEGKSGADISGISKDTPEQEVLYPRTAKFKVTRVGKDSQGRPIIGMREVEE